MQNVRVFPKYGPIFLAGEESGTNWIWLKYHWREKRVKPKIDFHLILYGMIKLSRFSPDLENFMAFPWVDY